MDLIGDEPVLNMADKFFRIYSKNRARSPQFLGAKSSVSNCLISEGSKIFGTVRDSVLSGGVVIEEGALVVDSVIMEDVVIKKGARVYSAIVDAESVIEAGATVGKEGARKDDITVISRGSVVKSKEDV